jgi:hypothetical protein
LALAAVQSHLRRQGHEELKASESTLLEQLTAEVTLVPLEPTSGKMTRQRRFAGGRSRCVRLQRSAIRGGDPGGLGS